MRHKFDVYCAKCTRKAEQSCRIKCFYLSQEIRDALLTDSFPDSNWAHKKHPVSFVFFLVLAVLVSFYVSQDIAPLAPSSDRTIGWPGSKSKDRSKAAKSKGDPPKEEAADPLPPTGAAAAPPTDAEQTVSLSTVKVLSQTSIIRFWISDLLASSFPHPPRNGVMFCNPGT